ncbi:hypothetical protein [Kitasatospora sp. NPDC050543]|uniref:hypothetical protein n=1 Tax=Kitasatospora sp. NPDC050543 TaxID=3364054 RepID=UPI003796AC76
MLGGIAAATYRDGLPSARPTAEGVTGAAVGTVRESLGGALAPAERAGGAGAGLARDAFPHSLGVVGLSGAALMLLAALSVRLLTPRDLDISVGGH